MSPSMDTTSIELVRKQLTCIAKSELEQALNRLPSLSDEAQAVLNTLTESIVARVLAMPQDVIEHAETIRQEELNRTLQCLFDTEAS